MSIAKICRLLACCKPGSGNDAAPSSLPEKPTVIHVKALPPKPAKSAIHHKYHHTMEDVLALVRTDPSLENESPRP